MVWTFNRCIPKSEQKMYDMYRWLCLLCQVTNFPPLLRPSTPQSDTQATNEIWLTLTAHWMKILKFRSIWSSQVEKLWGHARGHQWQGLEIRRGTHSRKDLTPSNYAATEIKINYHLYRTWKLLMNYFFYVSFAKETQLQWKISTSHLFTVTSLFHKLKSICLIGLLDLQIGK